MGFKVVVRRTDGSRKHKYFHGPDAESEARTYAEKVSGGEKTRSAVLVQLRRLPWAERPHWRAPW